MLESKVMWGFLARNRFLLAVMVAAFGLDQLTKLIVIKNVVRGTSWPDTGFFRITHIGNTGSAFGLFDGQNFTLIITSFVGIGILVYFYRVNPNPGLLVRGSLGLMLAGAFGNLTDRVVNGHVTDFIDIGPWWIFNLADASIMSGITGLAISTFLFGTGERATTVDSTESTGTEAVTAGPTATPANEPDEHVDT